MPVEQGLPWHPVATGLAGQAIPFIVAASHAHALPSAPFWFPVPAVLVASPALLCPSSLFAVLALVPPGAAPTFCVSVLLLPLSVGAPGCPCRAPPPVPPACPPLSWIGGQPLSWSLSQHLGVHLFAGNRAVSTGSLVFPAKRKHCAIGCTISAGSAASRHMISLDGRSRNPLSPRQIFAGCG